MITGFFFGLQIAPDWYDAPPASGGPANATLTVLLEIYDYAFGNSLGGDYGAAPALSLMLAGFLAVFSLVYMRATRSWSTE